MSQNIQITDKDKDKDKKLVKNKLKIVLQDNTKDKSTKSRVLDQHFFSSEGEGVWLRHVKSML